MGGTIGIGQVVVVGMRNSNEGLRMREERGLGGNAGEGKVLF